MALKFLSLGGRRRSLLSSTDYVEEGARGVLEASFDDGIVLSPRSSRLLRTNQGDNFGLSVAIVPADNVFNDFGETTKAKEGDSTVTVLGADGGGVLGGAYSLPQHGEEVGGAARR